MSDQESCWILQNLREAVRTKAPVIIVVDGTHKRVKVIRVSDDGKYVEHAETTGGERVEAKPVPLISRVTAVTTVSSIKRAVEEVSETHPQRVAGARAF